MMAYVSLDPDALQRLIDGLKGYATTAITNRDDAVNVNTYEDSPTSLTDFSDIVGLHCASLEDEAADLQNRLDAARAANESGLTTTGADGRTIAYVIPEGMEDTAENATASNNVDTVNQAGRMPLRSPTMRRAVATLTIGMLFWPECRPVRTIRPTPMPYWPISTRDVFSTCP